MPSPYQFSFTKLESLADLPPWNARYTLANGSTVDDYWEPRNLGEQFISTPSTDFTIRLTTTDVSPQATWNTKDGTNAHGPDQYFNSSRVAQIPNSMNAISQLSDPDAFNQKIGPTRNIETQGAGNCAGGVYVTDANSPVRFFPGTTGDITLDILPLVNTFMTARSAGATSMNLMLHGTNDLTPTYGEYKYVDAGSCADGSHNGKFYNTSAYMTFNSNDTPSLVESSGQWLSTITFRKNLRHVYFEIPFSSINGISTPSALNGNVNGQISFSNQQTLNDFVAAINSNGGFPTVAPFLRNTTVATDQNPRYPEMLTITPIENGIDTKFCKNRQMRFGAPQGNIMPFRVAATQPVLFTNPAGLNDNPLIGSVSPPQNLEYNSGISSVRYQLAPGINYIAVRITSPISAAGPHNLLELPAPTSIIEPRLFPSTFNGQGSTSPTNQPNLGITPGSYIRISGDEVGNNGIYKVLAIQDGIPGDISSQDSQFTFGSTHQYLYLDRPITIGLSPETVTIEKLAGPTNIRIVYRETIP
jgi:hypothetical protein